MPRWAWNKSPLDVKRRYFELIRQGANGSAASLQVGVSVSCGSVWFVDAGSVSFIDKPISSRYLSQDDRIEIADGLASGESVKVIAVRIGKSYQSVYREIARNRKTDGRYQPWFAHGQAHLNRRRPKPHRFSVDPELRDVVAAKLRKRWSPQQISRWLRRRWPKRTRWHVCAETIYGAVYQGLITAADQQTLRTGRLYRHRRGRGRTRQGALKQSTNMRSIHDRPAAVEDRKQAGHWEGDLIIGAGQRSAAATLVERKTRHTIMIPIRGGHSAGNVADALIAVLNELPAGLKRSLTWDQGNEMFQHERIEKATGIRIYFADPHSPWQRGSNENTKGLLRQYFPKGTDFDTISDDQLHQAADQLNNRPRLILKDRTPAQLMRQWLQPPIRNDD
ncbi:MAG: IS30 family transposase [Propionibacteriaceae bacterium]|jgi:IS30 family transposase|nr:IS30 family transposase [Propionibacteriaceae bacterium]